MKKKLLSLIFAICAILPCGIVLTACGGPAYTHSFETKCDDSYHWQECACGYKESETAHSFKIKYDGNNHWQECACSYKKDEASHIYDNDCDMTCSDCDYERTITHTYSKNWTVKEGEHYHICTKCGAIDETSHSVHAYKDGICSICDHIQNAVYTYNGWPYYYYSLADCKKATATSITIPAVYDDGIHGSHPVTSIGYSTFSGCRGLTSITIPNSVTSIGYTAFNNCTALTSITIPNSVTSIGSHAFSGCRGLTSIIVENGNTKYCVKGDCLIEIETGILLRGLNTSVIPTDGSVTSIGYSAFNNCTALTSITIPNSVTNIEYMAFYECTALTSVYYTATADDWNEITIGGMNSNLIAATKYYYIENEENLPTDGGNYWHYDKNGNPVVWQVTTTEE